jgi:hypothetical protein
MEILIIWLWGYIFCFARAYFRAYPTGRSKQMLSDRLRPPGRKMRLEHAPVGRRIVFGPSAATQTKRIFAPGMHRGGRCTDAPNDRSLFHRVHLAVSLYRGHRFRGQRFRVCAAAFAINDAATSSARALAGGGWASVPPSMASFRARGLP